MNSTRRSVLLVLIGMVLVGGSLSVTASAFAAEEYGLTSTFGSQGSGEGQLKEPAGVAVQASTGDVYVADKGNNRVEYFSSTGSYLGQFDGSAAPGGLPAPEDIAIDNDPSSPDYGDVYVTDNTQHVLDRFSASGVFEEQITGTCASPGTCPGSVIPFTGELSYVKGPFGALDGVVVDAAGNVWVFSNYEPTRKVPDLVFDEFSSTGGYEQTVVVEHGVNGVGLALGTEGDFYAPCCGGLPLRVTPTGEVVGAANTGGHAPRALAVMPSSNDLLIDEGDRIAQTGPLESPWKPLKKPGEQEPGERVEYLTTFGIGRLSSSNGLAVTPEGVLYASDSTEDDVSVFTPGAGEAPSITDESALTEAGPSARLKTTLYANNDEEIIRCKFEYGSEESLGNVARVPCDFEGRDFEGHEGHAVETTITGLEPGKTYYYRAIAKSESGRIGEGKIATFKVPNYPAPSTGEAQGITQTSATLSGTANPEGAETQYYFAYIDQAGYEKAVNEGDAEEKTDPYIDGEKTPVATLTASYTAQPVGPLPVSGLLPGSIYHYALVAYSYIGLTVGPDKTLNTLSANTPPLLSTGAASNVGQTSATLSGTVGTNGRQTDYGFEIATEPGNYGPATGQGSLSGALSETVTFALDELQPGTTYYYRLTATNADGTVKSEPVSFTTSGLPNLLSTPAPGTSQLPNPGLVFPSVSEQAGSTGTTTKALTKRQELTKAIEACKQDKSKTKKVKCEKSAHAKYGAAKGKKKN
jgi:hypothetical protein